MRFKRMNKISEVFQSEISKFNKAELTKLVRECQGLTPTNCWWVIYGLRGIVLEVAKCQLGTLKMQAKQAKAGSNKN